MQYACRDIYNTLFMNQYNVFTIPYDYFPFIKQIINIFNTVLFHLGNYPI